MISNETLQMNQTVGTGVAVVGNFDITDKTKARILISLSDKMYTRKELAPIREYSTNAADAHTLVGKSASEIVVTLPTMEDLNFRIRDVGTGLTESEVTNVYAVFGESTKRNSNDFNGLLGYGSKSGFAIADSFIVTSWINGEKSIYQCVKGDSTKLHSVVRLNREISTEPSGIEVAIPVNQYSMGTFHREAVDFFKYWPVMPKLVNLDSSEMERLENFRSIPATLKGEGWEIRPANNNSGGVAYMGWVPYHIDWQVLYHRMSLDSRKRVLFDLLQRNSVTLYFQMGEVKFVDSREQLEYTEATMLALMHRVESIFDKIKDAIQERFGPCSNLWEAKKMYNAIFGTGLLELEKGEDNDADVATRIKILDGNFARLETSFRGMFKWNDVVLNSASFDNIHRFDNATVGTINDISHRPMEPVMITYRKKGGRAKVNRCKTWVNNSIVASNHVALVINDTGRKSGQSAVARYLIFGTNSNIKSVHILTFNDVSTKNTFYNHYNFDSVPTYKLSEIILVAKAWTNANKVTRSYKSSDSEERSRAIRTLEYINVATGKIESGNIPLQELEEGGYFVELVEPPHRRRRWYAHQRYVKTIDDNSITDSEVARRLPAIIKEMDLDIDRVYLVSKQTRAAKWFGEALASGEWTPIWNHIVENIDGGLDIPSLINASDYAKLMPLTKKVRDYLRENIIDKNSPILRLINLETNKPIETDTNVMVALEELLLWSQIKGEHKATVNYAEIHKLALDSYPFLEWSKLDVECYADDAYMQKVANYINMADMWEKSIQNNLSPTISSECVVNPSDSYPSTTTAIDLYNENTSAVALA